MKNKKLFAILTLVCFMFTLMPVAAFAADPTLADAQKSWVYAEETEVDVKENATLSIKLGNNYTTSEVYVWFEQTTNVPSTALGTMSGDTFTRAASGILTVPAASFDEYEVAFDEAGTYTLHASLVAPTTPAAGETWSDAIAAIADYELKTESGSDKIVVSADDADSSKYVIKYNGKYYEDGATIPVDTTSNANFKANGIEEVTVLFTVYDDGKVASDNTVTSLGDEVYAYNVEVNGSSKVSVNDVKARRSGDVSFDVIAEKAGTHKIKVTIGSFEATFKLDATDGEAESIEVAYIYPGIVNIDTVKAGSNLKGYLLFEIFDANGNELTATSDKGFAYAQDSNNNYVSIVEQPAKSKIENDDLKLVSGTKNNNDGWTIETAKAFTEEGDYTFKVALDDGTWAKATLTMKEAGDPVALSISYKTESVQLGTSITPDSIGWLDANYVFTDYRTVAGADLKFTATGAAVANVDEATKTITVKTDEKYIGSEITVAVVDEDNNLIVTTTLTVAAEAKELVFDTTSVPVDVTKTIGVKLVDEDGKSVSLNATTVAAYTVVLSKPADCDVTADVTTAGVDPVTGTFRIEFSADAIGAVTIQAVLKAEVDNVVRYYTGTQTITVGADGFEDVVVMSIGSKEIVVNDAVKTIDAAPMISNNRTFVPFRALAEAFGATVAYDEATQAVTAELDGVTVVMTIGSATYTVNGVEKTADVAPFINDSRTMVPVRFVAQEFGVTVTPTYDDNGATADVVFAK